MSDTALPNHEAILKLCAAAAPAAWYPRDYAAASGVPRDSLYEPLNDLRISGLVQLTDWVKDRGQGYILTDLGQEVLGNPAYLTQLANSLRNEEDHVTAPTVLPAKTSGVRTPEFPRLVPILLLINILTFAASAVVATQAGVPLGTFLTKGDSATIHRLGGVSALDLLHGEWWRLLGCTFLHFGIFHLAANMFSLYFCARLESIWGAARFMFIYFVAGFAGSCSMMMVNPGTLSEPTVGAGASGAIWGLLAALIAWVLINRKRIAPEELAANINQFLIVMVLNIGMCWVPMISASAHAGGALAGLLLAGLLHIHRLATEPRRFMATLLIITLPLLFGLCLYQVMRSDPRWQRIEREEVSRIAERELNEQVPHIDETFDAFDKLDDEAMKLLNVEPDKRGKAAVSSMQEELTQVLTKSHDLAEKLPPNDKLREDIERRRRLGREALEKLTAFATELESMLRENRTLAGEEAGTLRSRRKEYKEAMLAWKKRNQ